MKPVVLSRSESRPVNDPHSEAHWTAPVVTLPDDQATKLACERLLNPAERRRFRYLHAEAMRNGAGVRPAIRLALRRMREEVTANIEKALRAGR